MAARGLSLVEILVVVVMLALLATLSYPAMTAAMAEARVRDAANELLQTLQFARFQAVLRGRAQLVKVTPEAERPGGSFTVREARAESCNDLLPDVTRAVVLPPADQGGDVGLAAMAPAGMVETGVCFKPDGKAYDGTGAAPSLSSGERASYNVARAGNVAFRFLRYQQGGEGLEPVGVRKEVLLSHLGIGRINTELADEAGE
jgi:prepilin-type N-terminal cleavage/methylation domain-containing protein